MSLGGILGSLLRWQITESTSSLPLLIFIVNQLGVLVAGVVAYRVKTGDSGRLFWIPGFAGGFTTMSSLAYILSDLHPIPSFLYGVITLLASLLILEGLKVRKTK
ncbi:MAG: FluC/FEX family fluoride channel [Candidatus Planktophila sp.]